MENPIEIGGEAWAVLKRKMLKQIQNKNGVSPEDIYFIDDTEINVNEAKKDFPNSIFLNPPGSINLIRELNRISWVEGQTY